MRRYRAGSLSVLLKYPCVEHFQQVAGYRHAHVFPRRLFIGDSYKQFVDGKLADDELSMRLKEQAEQFLEFIGRMD